MSNSETGNFHPIYATAFQDACQKPAAELKDLVACANDYISHFDDVTNGLSNLEAALKQHNK